MKDDNELIEPFTFIRGPVGCLLIHGFTGTPWVMRGLGEYLAEAGISVLGIRLPGHGTTPEDLAKTDLPMWIDAAEEGWKKLASSCQQAFVCGFSLGGLLALHLAAHQAVDGVIALSTPIFRKDRLLPIIRLAKYFIKFHTRKMPELHDRSLLDLLNRFSYSRIPLVSIERVWKLLPILRSELPKVTAPLVLMYGCEDKQVPLSNAQMIYQKVASQDKEVVELPHSHHHVTIDADREVVKAKTLQFIKRISEQKVSLTENIS